MSGYPAFIYHRPSGVARPLEGCEIIHPTIKPEIIDGFPALHVDDTLLPGESLDSLLMVNALLENRVSELETTDPSGSDGSSKFRFTVEVDLSYNVRVVEGGDTFDA